MELRTILSLAGLCSASFGSGAPALANDVPSPAKDAFESAYFSMLNLCPKLVAAGNLPDAVKLSDYGLAPSTDGLGDWQGKFDNGIVILDLDAAERRCSVSLGSAPALSFGDFIIGQIEQNGYTLLVDRRKEPIAGGVWIKLSANRIRRGQFTVAKNPTGPLLTVSFTEKANF